MGEREGEEGREGREECDWSTVTFDPSVQPDTFMYRTEAHGEGPPADLHCCPGTDFVVPS